MLRSTPGRLVRVSNPNINCKQRNWQSSSSSSSCSGGTIISSQTTKLIDEETSSITTTTDSTTTNSSGSNDSRKSILECDVNPYLLLKNQQQRRSLLTGKDNNPGSVVDEDDLSDELSDNALEREQHLQPSDKSSNLFDHTKVKSIERTPTGRSSVAAIGGQRIRVFNEDEFSSSSSSVVQSNSNTLQQQSINNVITRIPIPKISPKRPPRRLREAKNALKSILKRADRSLFITSQPIKHGKSVLFNVDNVILAPEKPSPDLSMR